MKRPARHGKGSAPKRPLVLVFGESEHDRKAIATLAGGLRPDLARTIEQRRKPLVLIKNAVPEKGRSNAEQIAALVRIEASARRVLAVLAHEDCDAIEPAHVGAARKIEDELEAARCPGKVIGVTPAWEIETWWLLAPSSTRDRHPSKISA